MTGEELRDCGAEGVVAVARHHVPGVADVDELGVARVGEKFGRPLLADHVTHAATHEQCRHPQLLGGAQQPLRLLRCGGTPRAFDEARIPMPAVTTVLVQAQILAQPAKVGRPLAVGHVGRDRVGRVVEGGEAVQPAAHEGDDAFDAAGLESRRAVDENDRGDVAGALAGSKQGRQAAERCADNGGGPVERGGDRSEVGNVGIDCVVAVGRPIAVAVPAHVHRDRPPAGFGERLSGRPPGVPCLATAVQEHDRRRTFLTPDVGDETVAVAAAKGLAPRTVAADALAPRIVLVGHGHRFLVAGFRSRRNRRTRTGVAYRSRAR